MTQPWEALNLRSFLKDTNNVSVINKRSLKDLHSSLESTVEQISNLNPDAVYILLGTRDIVDGTEVDSVLAVGINNEVYRKDT